MSARATPRSRLRRAAAIALAASIVTAYTVVHMFSGSGGCSLGFQREGFKITAAIDNDADACADLDYLCGEKASVVADIGAMEAADLRRVCGPRRPDVYVSTPPCKFWSDCLPKKRRSELKYIAMGNLAIRAILLALEAWDEPPPLILMENVRGMKKKGAAMVGLIRKELAKYGYLFDTRMHDCGELGGLAQHRQRYLLVARRADVLPSFLMVPPSQRVRACGEELGLLPPPIMDARSDSMHRLPQLSGLNWIRLALIPPGKDWKALPERVRLGGDPTDRRDGKFGVERWDDPAHVVTGVGNRVPSGWSAIADPRVNIDPETGELKRESKQNGGLGVNDWTEPAHIVLGEGSVQNTYASIADLRMDLGPNAHNGILGVEHPDRPAHCVTGNARPQGSWGGFADPRLRDRNGELFEQWSGSYGVCDPNEPAPTIVGAMKHDNSPGSYADTHLDYSPHRGSYKVLDPGEPADTVRGHMDVRQAPGAVADAGIDPRVPWDPADYGGRPHGYGLQPWDEPASTVLGKQVLVNSRASVAHPAYPAPTHYVVQAEDGELVIVGPPIDLDKIQYLVIQALDGSWHRPMTDLELAALQSFPVYVRGELLALRGPSAKRREHIGNALPTWAAQAIARACRATLDAGDRFNLLGPGSGKIWVRPRAVRGRWFPELRDQPGAAAVQSAPC